MAEIHIHQNDIKSIVASYANEDDSFVIKSFTERDSQKKCQFFLGGVECTIIFYLKKNSVKITPTGKNKDTAVRLIKYIESKGFSAKSETNQFVFPCTNDIIENLIEYIDNECNGLVSCQKKDNTYKFIGYNGDMLTFNYYPQSKKAQIQGRPFHAYSIVISYLSELPDFTFDQIVEINNGFINMNTPSSAIRKAMTVKLGKAYDYLDEALLKSISGSLTLLKQTTISEDYTGCVTGVFKALEGYLKKLLSQNYGYTLEKYNTFNMFYHPKAGQSGIESNSTIPTNAKKELNYLYKIYSNKRNLYLHATINPSQTRIIPKLREADDLSNDILSAISKSYSIFFSN